MYIHLENITIRAGDRDLFPGTSWRIETGQRWALVGGNGSGKSTLVRALAGKAPLCAGRVIYGFGGEPRPYLQPGEVLVFSTETHRQFLRRRAGYHQARWQSFEADESPTVAEALAAAGPAGPADGPLFDNAIDLLGLRPLLPRRLVHLSNGESRRAALACLLVQQPRLLILDNPYAGLDASSRAALEAGMEALFARGSPAVLFVTARPAELPAAVTHVCLVTGGRVAALGLRADVLVKSPAAAPAPAPVSGFDASITRFSAALRAQEHSLPPVLVDLQSVSVVVDGTAILQDVTWQVRRGERWALLGPNGAGKTTLLSLILADHPQAYRNCITLFGRPRGSGETIWEIKEKIGWVSPELQAFYPPETTCRAVVASGFFDSSGLHRRPSPVQAAAAEGWLDAFGLSPLAAQSFQSLSAGQQRLALLARALVKNPPLLILDEPCHGLDDVNRRVFLDLVDRLCAQSPVSLVYITHDPLEIPSAVTRTLRLASGRVISP